MTVGELSCRVGAWELAEWKVIFGEQPFGVERDNFHAGIIASSIYNVNRKKGTEPIKADLFMVMDSRQHRASNLSSAIDLLKKIAVPVSQKELKAKIKKSRVKAAAQKQRKRKRT